MQGGRRRRGHPGGVRAGLRLGALGVEHRAHRRRAGPTCPCRSGRARRTRRAARRRRCGLRTRCSQVVDFSSSLRTTGPASKSEWISSPVRSRKPGVDEDHPLGGAGDARLEVDRRAPLLVHDPDLDGGGRQLRAPAPRRRTGRPTGSTSSGPCIFGLTTYRLPVRELEKRPSPRRSCSGRDRGDQDVQALLQERLAAGGRHGVEAHVVPDVADEQQRPPGEHHLGAVDAGVGAVAVHGARDRLPALGEGRLQLTGHQAEPAAVAADLVRAVDGGDGVLQVDDRGDRRLQHDVRDVRVVLAADPVPGVDGQLDVQAVPAQQHRLRRARVAAVPDELLRVGEPDGPVRGLRGQRAAVEAVGGDVGVGGALRAGSRRRAAGRPPRSPARRAARRSRGRARGPAAGRPCRRARRTATPSGRSRRSARTAGPSPGTTSCGPATSAISRSTPVTEMRGSSGGSR